MATRHLLAHHRPHAPAHEGELQRGEAHAVPADGRHARQHRILHPGRLLGRLDPIGVVLLILEMQRVQRADGRVPLLEAARVHQQFNAGPRPDAEMMLASRADAGVSIQLLLVDALLAVVALDPESLGHPDLGFLQADQRFFLEPGHSDPPMQFRRAE